MFLAHSFRICNSSQVVFYLFLGDVTRCPVPLSCGWSDCSLGSNQIRIKWKDNLTHKSKWQKHKRQWIRVVWDWALLRAVDIHRYCVYWVNWEVLWIETTTFFGSNFVNYRACCVYTIKVITTNESSIRSATQMTNDCYLCVLQNRNFDRLKLHVFTNNCQNNKKRHHEVPTHFISMFVCCSADCKGRKIRMMSRMRNWNEILVSDFGISNFSVFQTPNLAVNNNKKCSWWIFLFNSQNWDGSSKINLSLQTPLLWFYFMRLTGQVDTAFHTTFLQTSSNICQVQEPRAVCLSIA